MAATFVLDCSVAAKWIFFEPAREAALGLLDQYESGHITLIAPDLLMTEFASLAARKVRCKDIASAQARDAFRSLTQNSPKLYATPPLLPKALDLSMAYHLSLWDCVYLALAIERDAPMITADRRLIRGAKGLPLQFLGAGQ